MTLKEMYEAVLIEIDKDSAPNLLLEDFNYYARKASYQYVNKRYNVYDTSQQTGDDLHVLKSNAIININDENNLVKERYNMWSTQQPAVYEFNLPTDYFHLLKCECFYELTKPYKCYRQGNYVHFPATRLTADISAKISTNAWLKPDWKRPYYYIHNINTQNEFPYNPYNKESKTGNDIPEVNTITVTDKVTEKNNIVQEINNQVVGWLDRSLFQYYKDEYNNNEPPVLLWWGNQSEKLTNIFPYVPNDKKEPLLGYITSLCDQNGFLKTPGIYLLTDSVRVRQKNNSDQYEYVASNFTYVNIVNGFKPTDGIIGTFQTPKFYYNTGASPSLTKSFLNEGNKITPLNITIGEIEEHINSGDFQIYTAFTTPTSKYYLDSLKELDYIINAGTAKDANNYNIADTDSADVFKVALFNGNYSNVERSPQVRYGNPTNVRCEIRYGTDNSVFKLKQVQIDYVKVPQYLELTQEQLDRTEDTSQVLEFPDYVCQEIVNELIHLIMEKDRNDRIQTHPVVSQSIATQQQAPVQQQNNN